MPGLVGIINKKKKSENLQYLNHMIDCMMHEKFYNSGKFIVEDIGFYGGWVNIKNSFCDCMPIVDKKESLAILFFGENIKDSEYVNKYTKKEVNKSIKSRAEYLIDLYQETKSKFFTELNGFFHGVVVDIKNKKISLFIDRYGMQRLYYYNDRSEFIFSSEAKAILKIRPHLKEIDLYSLGEYLRCGCVMNDKTLFKKIKLLPGGSLWTFQNNGKIDKNNYFVPSMFENQPKMNANDFLYEIKDVFREILPKYFLPEGKVGLSLTGGLDTRMILAASNIQPGKLPCFTYGGVYRDSYDVKVSKEVAEASGQKHHTIRADRDFLKNFNEFAHKTIYLSDGCVDITAAPNLYVSKKARDIADIRLTGNYGQELLRRYIAFKPSPIDEKLFSKQFIEYLKKAAEVYKTYLNNYDRLTFALFKQAPWFQYGRYSVESSQIIQRSPFMDNDLVKLVYQAPVSVLNDEEISKRIIYDSSNVLGNIMTDLGKLGKLPFWASKIFKLWRFFLFKMEWYYNHKLPRPVERLDNVLRPLNIEKYFLGRNKYYHMRTWIRGELSEYVKETLLSQKCKERDIFNSNYIEKIVDDHTKNRRSNTDNICAVLSIEIIYNLFID